MTRYNDRKFATIQWDDDCMSLADLYAEDPSLVRKLKKPRVDAFQQIEHETKLATIEIEQLEAIMIQVTVFFVHFDHLEAVVNQVTQALLGN